MHRTQDKLEERVKERTEELVKANSELNIEISERKQAQEALQKAYDEIGQLKQQIEAENIYLAATNRDLEALVKSNHFRDDLWYRLNVFPITVPPLRERSEDIPLIVHYFVKDLSKKAGRNIDTISLETMKSLTEYAWPGNVRELRNIIERAVIGSSSNTLQLAERLMAGPAGAGFDSRKTLAETEKEIILHTLKQTRWRIEGEQGAAKILGRNPSTLRGRVRKYRITRP